MQPFKRTLLAILLFGSAFGYLEAAVVSYLRELHEPARQRFHPGRPPGDLFPLLSPEQVHQSVPPKLLATEIGREAATILMLAGIALATAGNTGQWAAVLGIAFGTWDITFYLFLKLLLDWPASLFTWDILFLLPVPWAGPVLAPILVSAAMIGAGVYHLWREAARRPVRIGRARWFGIAGGAFVIILAFAFDYQNILAGGMPHPFNWGMFGLGLVGGLLHYVNAAIAKPDAAPVRILADARQLP
jgi:hypothetical protein